MTTAVAFAALIWLFPASAKAQLGAGDLVVADPNAFGGNGGLIVVDPASGAQRPLSDDSISALPLFRDPTGVEFDPNGTIVVADPNAFGGSGGLIRVDPATGQQTPLSNNEISSNQLFADPVGVTVAPSGELLVSDSGALGGSGAVISVDPTSGQQTLVSSNAQSSRALFADPFGIALESNGTILVADPGSPAPVSGTSGAIIAVDPSSGEQRLVTNNDSSRAPLFDNPLGVAIETPGTVLVANSASSPNANGVILVNRSSGQQYGLSTDANFAAPTGIAMDLDGHAIVADSAAAGGAGALIRIDPATGSEAFLSGDPTAPIALFADPSGITVVPPTCFGRYATIVGTEGADALTGTPGPDVISGRRGEDIIDGQGGGDRICGDEGRDRLIGRDGKDRFVGGGSSDVVLAGKGADLVRGGRGRDKVYGGGGADRLYGEQNPDVLAGGSGNDLLVGGPGADKLRGGPGRDRLRGGPGRDKQQP